MNVTSSDVVAGLNKLADELCASPADLVVVVISSPQRALPDVRVFGRLTTHAEVKGLLVQGVTHG